MPTPIYSLSIRIFIYKCIYSIWNLDDIEDRVIVKMSVWSIHVYYMHVELRRKINVNVTSWVQNIDVMSLEDCI